MQLRKQPPQHSLKKEVQSYLKWLYLQNSKFSIHLTNEEIVNYFLYSLKHSQLFQRLIEEKPLSAMSLIYETVDKYKESSDIFEIAVPIQPVIDGPYVQ